MPYDPAKAKKLLAEAGYPNGFSITLGAPNGRYINDLKIAQAVAVDVEPHRRQDRGRRRRAAGVLQEPRQLQVLGLLAGWGASTGELSNALKALLATPDRAKGMGTTNRGRYSNKAMDAKLVEALVTVDDAKREALLAEASKIAIQQDHGLHPDPLRALGVGDEKGLTYKGRADQNTLAISVKPAK